LLEAVETEVVGVGVDCSSCWGRDLIMARDGRGSYGAVFFLAILTVSQEDSTRYLAFGRGRRAKVELWGEKCHDMKISPDGTSFGMSGRGGFLRRRKECVSISNRWGNGRSKKLIDELMNSNRQEDDGERS
jgi:hypothetical protein